MHQCTSDEKVLRKTTGASFSYDSVIKRTIELEHLLAKLRAEEVLEHRERRKIAVQNLVEVGVGVVADKHPTIRV